MSEGEAKLRVQQHVRIVKRDEAGQVFEVIEGVEDNLAVTFRRPGQPPESYATLPVQEGQ